VGGGPGRAAMRAQVRARPGHGEETVASAGAVADVNLEDHERRSQEDEDGHTSTVAFYIAYIVVKTTHPLTEYDA
jgi:hypothetical protein